MQRKTKLHTMKHLLLWALAFTLSFGAVAQTEKALKRKVAIGRFTNSTKNPNSIFYDKQTITLFSKSTTSSSSREREAPYAQIQNHSSSLSPPVAPPSSPSM